MLYSFNPLPPLHTFSLSWLLHPRSPNLTTDEPCSVAPVPLNNVLINYETGGELDYYLVKETTESAMQDAVDVEYYRQNLLIRIDKEKFVENFLRRFADSVDATRGYTIRFYDINEVPPKVSVKVDSYTVLSFDNQSPDISTSYDAIIETDYKTNPKAEVELKDPNSNVGKGVLTK